MVAADGGRIGRIAKKLKIGMFGGLLNGYCGYYVVAHNKSKQVLSPITIYKDAQELLGTVVRAGGIISSLLLAFYLF